MSDCTIFFCIAVSGTNQARQLQSETQLQLHVNGILDQIVRYNEAFTDLKDIAEQTRENEGMMVKRFLATQSMSFIRSKRGGARRSGGIIWTN